MHTKPRTAKGATFPLTIHTPFGVLRMAYAYELEPCPGCGQHHGSVVMLDASPRLKTREAEPFLDVLPELLSAAGDLAFLHCVSDQQAPKALTVA